MVDYSRDQSFNDYMTAEQIVMGLKVMLRQQVISNSDTYRTPLEAMYDSLDNQHEFNVWKFGEAIKRFSGMRGASK